MRRRTFLVGAPALARAAVALPALVASGCAAAGVVVPSLDGGRLRIPKASVGPDGAWVHPPGWPRPVWVRPDGAEAWTAVLAQCTHQGCQPEPLADRLVCPCHGSEFSWAGEVLQGPAERPLPRFVVREEGPDLLLLDPAGEGSR